MRASKTFRPEVENASGDRWRSYQDALVREAATRASRHTPAFRARLDEAGLSIDAIHGVFGLTELPVLSKDELPGLQESAPPFGGMLAVEPHRLSRIYLSPGPILDPEGEGSDYWGFAPALWAAGFRAGDTVYNTFSYHLSPAGAMMDGGLRALGCTVVPGGVGNTDAQVEFLHRVGGNGYCGTPDFLLTLLERAREKKFSVGLRRAFVSGAPLSSSLREWLGSEFGVVVLQGYGTADVGAIGYECDALAGWHVAPGRVVEIVDPSSGERLADGATGEVVVTSPSSVYPLVRFGTGDLSALDSGPCGCGRSTPRLQGFQGRVGEGVKVRGVFVHPRQVVRALGSLGQTSVRFQAIVTAQEHRDEIVVRIEDTVEVDPGRLAAALAAELKLRVGVELVPSIAEDAAPIRDERSWE